MPEHVLDAADLQQNAERVKGVTAWKAIRFSLISRCPVIAFGSLRFRVGGQVLLVETLLQLIKKDFHSDGRRSGVARVTTQSSLWVSAYAISASFLLL